MTFQVDAQELDNASKDRLLLHKMNTISYKQYIDYNIDFAKRIAKDYDFATTVNKHTIIWKKNFSLPLAL